MSAEPPEQRDESVTVRLQEQAPAEQLALKDHALDARPRESPLPTPGCPVDR